MAQPALQAAETDDVRQSANAGPGRDAAAEVDLSALMRTSRWAIEEERLHELRIPLSSGVPAYAELPHTAETIFMNGNRAAPLPGDDDNIERFLSSYGVSLLCYGYPYLQYADGSIRPLFLMRAKIEDCALCPDPDGYLKINCALLRDQGVEPLQIQGLAHKIADPAMPFPEKLAMVAKRLGLAADRFNPAELDEVTAPGALGRMQWRNRAILASATMAPSVSALLRDLNDLSSAEAQHRIGATALGGIQAAGSGGKAGDDEKQPHLDAPMVFDMHRLGYSQTQAVRAGMKHRLIAVTAPPGTGQMATVVNLIATAVMNGQSVLYTARRRETVDAMTNHLNAWVGRKMSAVVRVGDGAVNEACRAALTGTLREMQRPAAEADEGDDADGAEKKAPSREKPTLKDMEELDRLPVADNEGIEPLRAAHAKVNELNALMRREALELGLGRVPPARRITPCPNTETLRGWREEFAILNGDKSAGISKMMKGMLSRNDGRGELLSAIRGAVAKLPSVIKEQAADALDNDDQLAGIAAGLEVLGIYFEWRQTVAKRDAAIRDLIRFKDCRTLELQAMNQSARKISGVRELYRDYWSDRLQDDPAVLENQVATFFDLIDKRYEGEVNETRAHRSARLAQAVGILAEQLPVWSATLEETGQALPLEPGYFDLVVIDEADLGDLGVVLPVLYRGKRAAVFGAARHDQRLSPLPPEWEAKRQFSQTAAKVTMRPASLTALGNLSALLAPTGGVYQLLGHYRSHPRIAEYLSSTFYDNTMVVQTNFRKLRSDAPDNLLGVQWHHVTGRMTVVGNNSINEGEVKETEKLIRAWVDDGLFRGLPRRSVGIATPIPAQADQIREFIKRGKFPENVRERITVATPDLFLGRQVDFIILLPGLAPDAPDALNQALAGAEDLYHDVVGAARLGLHIVGDRDVCRDVGGLGAALSSFAEDPPAFDENGELIPDDFEIRFDKAFGDKNAEAPLNPWPALRQMLLSAGFPFQSNVAEGELTLAVRLVSPLGGRYNIEIAAPLEAVRGDHELEVERNHDEVMVQRGYGILRLTPTEILEKNNFIRGCPR
ncbi:MAG: AAA domain-containing protein [Alphaproteobacteria bacterium]